MIASIDASMRSTGVCVVNEKGDLVDFCIVSNKDATDLELLEYNIEGVMDFLLKHKGDLTDIIIEGLAFGAKCKRADILFSNYWFMRYFISKEFGDSVNYNVYPVTTWRKTFISKERAKEVKDRGENKKGWQKKECVGLLDEEVKVAFELYVKENKFKKDAIFDLTDSFLQGKHHVLEKTSG
jgi:hypothetical protein